MADTPYHLPDPLITANIYCSARLDEVIYKCVAPFWQQVNPSGADGRCYLWLMRYRRCGEHLKIRVHAPSERGAELRSALEEAANTYLGSLGPIALAKHNPTGDRAPPIDVEDEATEPYPDRSFLWTTYRRSPIAFGAALFVADDRFAALFTRAMGYASEQVLAALKPRSDGGPPFQTRQVSLLKAVISGLAGLGWTAGERARYLAYHRDWLLRFTLASAGQGPEQARALLERFQGNKEKMASALPVIGKTLASQWDSDGAAGDDRDDGWPAALRDLARHVRADSSAPDRRVDPFAALPEYVPVMKVLHGMANQLGLKPLDESFLHHLVLHLHAPDDDPGFIIEPPFLDQ